VGSALKAEGRVDLPVEASRAAAFTAAIERLRRRR